MKAITVQQPYGTAIVREVFGKGVENRRRNIVGAFRGVVAIHAGLAVPRGRRGTRTVFPMIGEVERDLSGLLLRSERLAWPYRLPLGAVIGVAEIVDVHEWADEDACNGTLGTDGLEPACSEWAAPEVWHIVLANSRPLAHPVPARGFLGLWTLPDDVEAAVLEQIGGAA